MNENDRAILGIVSVSHALVHTYELTIPILMVTWLLEFPITEATLGLIVAVGYALFGIGALPSGILADKYGSQRLIAVCLLGMGASYLVLSFATSVLVIAVSIAFWGAAASLYHPSGLSLISTGVKNSGTGFAYHGMAGNAGIALGPLVAVILMWFVDWRIATAILAVPAIVAAAYVLQADIDRMAAADVAADGSGRSQPGVTSLTQLFADSKRLFIGGFGLVFLILIFNGLYYRGILTFLPGLLADFVQGDLLGGAVSDLEGFEISDLIYVGLLFVGVIGQYVGGKATDRVQVERGLVVGYAILIGIALLFVPASSAGFAALIGVSLLLGFFLFMLQPIYQATVARYSPAESRGLSYGYTYLAQFGFGALGAAIVGFVLTYSTVSVAFLVLGVLALFATLISTYLFLRAGHFDSRN